MLSVEKVHRKEIVEAGKNIQVAKKALILIHGRAATAEDIFTISRLLNLSEDYALLAPQATNNTWYPYSFMAKTSENEPWLSSALDLLKQMLNDIMAYGIGSQNIYLLGFSQGACLCLEFAARHAAKYGGVVAFTGGLLGDEINRNNYSGDFKRTNIFIGSSDSDPHVPFQRVKESEKILSEMNANVILKIFPNRGHTISQDEIDSVNKFIFT